MSTRLAQMTALVALAFELPGVSPGEHTVMRYARGPARRVNALGLIFAEPRLLPPAPPKPLSKRARRRLRGRAKEMRRGT